MDEARTLMLKEENNRTLQDKLFDKPSQLLSSRMILSFDWVMLLIEIRLNSEVTAKRMIEVNSLSKIEADNSHLRHVKLLGFTIKIMKKSMKLNQIQHVVLS